jgi:hypothetical protein
MVCVKCGATLEEGATACPKCGEIMVFVLNCESGNIKLTGPSIGTVVESPFGHPQGRYVISKPASGDQSDSKVDNNGTLHVDLLGSLDKGTPNEWHVKKILEQALKAEGNDIHQVIDPKDDRLNNLDVRGMDGLFKINDHEVAIQIVTVPTEPQLWKELADSKASSRSVDRSDAVRWIRDVLVHKMNKAENTLLALDASHFSAMVGQQLIDDYINKYGNPIDEFTFKDVWIIGATVQSSIRLRTSVKPSHTDGS